MLRLKLIEFMSDPKLKPLIRKVGCEVTPSLMKNINVKVGPCYRPMFKS